MAGKSGNSSGNAACKQLDLSLEVEDDDGSHPDPHRPGAAKSYSLRTGISNILLPRAPHRTGADSSSGGFHTVADDSSDGCISIGDEDSTAAFAPRALHRASADLLPGGPHHDELLAGGPHRAAAGSSSDGIHRIADDRARLPEPLHRARASLRSDGIGAAPFDKPDTDSSGSVDAPDEDRASPFDSMHALGEALPKPDPYSFPCLRAALPKIQPDVDSSSESLLAKNKTDVDSSFEALLARHKPKDVNEFNALRASIPVTTFIGVDCDFVKPDPPPRPKHFEEYIANEWKKYVEAQLAITHEERRKMDTDTDTDEEEPDLVLEDPDSE